MSPFFISLRLAIPLGSSALVATTAFSQSFRFEGNPSGWAAGGIAGSVMINARCTENQIADNTGAMERIDWADRCGHVSKQKWSNLYFNNVDPVTLLPYPRAKYAYPIFVHDVRNSADPSQNYPLWVPDYTTCDMPNDVLFFSICEAGCYTPDQKIAFTKSGKPQLLSIKDAFQGFVAELNASPIPKESKLRLFSVTKGSTLENLSFGTLPLKRVVSSVKDENNTILTIRTQSGGEIKVTPEHPLVSSNGQFRKAQHFKVGDSLVRQTGRLDSITEITEGTFFGKVYNLEPRSSDPTENIHVAQGFLAGSLAVQNGELRDLNRVLQRVNSSSETLTLK